MITNNHDRSVNKWSQAILALLIILLCYVLYSFLIVLSQWTQLEVKVAKLPLYIQGLSALIGVSLFIGLGRNAKFNQFSYDISSEIQKIAWAPRNQVKTQAVVIIIGITIVGFFLGLFDVISQWLLSQL